MLNHVDAGRGNGFFERIVSVPAKAEAEAQLPAFISKCKNFDRIISAAWLHPDVPASALGLTPL
jgi:hypothetical protein